MDSRSIGAISKGLQELLLDGRVRERHDLVILGLLDLVCEIELLLRQARRLLREHL